jgi:hypothetical protein
MKKFFPFLILLTVVPAFAQTAATSVSLLDWVNQTIAVVQEFIARNVSWQVEVMAVITLIISSMKVTVLNQWFWSKLGTLQDWLAPALGLALGMTNVYMGGNWQDVLAYVAAGAGAPYLHDLLDLIKVLPGIGPLWVDFIDVIENIPIIGTQGSNIVVSNEALLSIADGILTGAEEVAAQAVWAEVLASQTWLTLPIIGPAAAWIYFQIISFLSAKSLSFFNWFVLGFKVAAQKQVYDTAVSNLQAAIAKGDPNAVAQANTDFNNALANLVNSDLPTGPAE